MKTRKPSVIGGSLIKNRIASPSRAGPSAAVPAARVQTGITAIAGHQPAPGATKIPATSTDPLGTVNARANKLADSDWLAFSQAPDKLSKLLKQEIDTAFEFSAKLADAFTFFGGARIEPSDPFFGEGKGWGEAVLLTNAATTGPGVVQRAAASGLFSAEAVAAASGVALGVAAGSFGPKALAQQLANIGGASSPEALGVALAQLQGRRTNVADAQLLMTLTRTGAGPGMMEAVPLGYLDAKNALIQLMPELGQAALDDFKTQGSRIKLPFEQATSPYVQQIEQFAHFLPRRLALTEQSAGFIVFPGGFGTLNEMFEVLRLGRPTVLHSKSFWSKMVGALTDQWKARDLVDPSVLQNLAIVDGPAEGLPHLLDRGAKSTPPPPPTAERAAQMCADVQRGLATLSKMPSAVTFIGGQRLKATDPEIPVAKDIAARLAKSGIPARAGGGGVVLDAVSQGAAAGNPKLPVQALLLDHGDLAAQSVADKADVFEVVHSEAAHKLLMYENTDAIVALPGGVGTFDEVFEVACLMQTGKIPKRPLILVGKSFWQPFLDAMTESMLNGERKTIAPGDQDLFAVVDDAVEAARLVRKSRATREEEHA